MNEEESQYCDTELSYNVFSEFSTSECFIISCVALVCLKACTDNDMRLRDSLDDSSQVSWLNLFLFCSGNEDSSSCEAGNSCQRDLKNYISPSSGKIEEVEEVRSRKGSFSSSSFGCSHQGSPQHIMMIFDLV